MTNNNIPNTYAIPANYTDSGRLFGGMLEPRNALEAVFLVGLVGYPQIAWLHIPITAKIIVMTVTLLPLGILAVMGVGGDSLLQYAGHIVRFGLHRRKIHFRRIGGKDASRQNAQKQKERKRKA